MTYVVSLTDEFAQQVTARMANKIVPYKYEPLEGATQEELHEAAGAIVNGAIAQATIATIRETAVEVVSLLVEQGLDVRVEEP